MLLTCLDARLLFLVGTKGQSGYDIRQIFQSTPLGIFSDSPGAIYPALARLEKRGLLVGVEAAGGRRRRVFDRTQKGGEALTTYLCQPIKPRTLARRPEELELRYVMIAVSLGEAQAAAFAGRCGDAFEGAMHALIAFCDGPGQAMGAPSLRALDLGIRLYRTRLQWCRDMAALAEPRSTQGETHAD